MGSPRGAAPTGSAGAHNHPHGNASHRGSPRRATRRRGPEKADRCDRPGSDDQTDAGAAPGRLAGRRAPRALDSAARTPFPAHDPAILGSGMAPLHELELMIQSHYPLVAIETFEEARLERILGKGARSLRVPFVVGSVTNGPQWHVRLDSFYDSPTP